ncbi:ABC transporter permease [Nocardioides sp. Kera G14]|uniref:ABC transporter permease n=1 Tax=Nocardioides sp. Kera G14 TaxID=2884264 RepID=UPI001D10E848|nr:ABC transporter permease [Nocardioides sp. Kera G14]UDY22245.1 ABC transporter permease [Nocardioides sp. Kera G14]
MGAFLSYTVIGLFTGAAYAIAASGLVLTYNTTRVFNVAHGAFGMVFAFVYWDFSQRQGLPGWLALALVLLVVAPIAGIVVERFVARGLGSAPVGVSLVVTVGLLVGLIGLATQVWKPAARNVPQFFDGHLIHLGSVLITWHEVITIVLSGVVAGGLYLLLNRTRIGTAMRASVDNPDLLRLYGGRPQVVAALAWAVGMSLAALAGIMLTPVIGLQYYDLTLLVISAYAAAMLGRLRSLPLTYAGAMALGLLQSYAVGYLPGTGDLSGLRAVMPTLFLFAVILLVPQASLRIGQVRGLLAAPVPSARKSLAWAAGTIGFSLLLVAFLSDVSLLRWGTAAAYAIVMLSMVLLTGYGGHVSLAQLSFAGVGALTYAKIDQPNLLGVLIAALVAALAGGLVALPTLRLTGLYLALSTLAFAQLMDKLIFAASWAFKPGGTLAAERLSVFGIRFSDLGAYVGVMMLAFVLVGLGVLALRRGPLGRVLIASRDSQAACGTLGLDLRWFRVGLFAASAGIAGLGGALFAGLRGTIGAGDFQFFNSLLLLLAAVVFGATSVTGALLGGLFLMYLPVAQSDHPAIAGLCFVVLGFGAVALGRDPNGLANRLFGLRPVISNRLVPFFNRQFPQLSAHFPTKEERDVAVVGR